VSDGLSGRVAVIIGASSGIGLAIARRFLGAGATVHAVARRKAPLENARLRTHTFDVTDRPQLERGIAEIAAEAPIDVLVYSAGYNVPKRRLAEVTPEDWDAILRVNLDAAFNTLRTTLISLRKTHGTAIFISSGSAAWPNLSGAAYQASKAGLFGLTRAAAYEEHRNGVRISVILPGVVDTPHLDRRPNPPDAKRRANMLQPDDVAAACLFLATLPERAYVPELHLLPTYLQAPGKTDESTFPE
jgi:NAD(P)-dependent dehydrogenase (short-subunit alcohol dehydrogenase family)